MLNDVCCAVTTGFTIAHMTLWDEILTRILAYLFDAYRCKDEDGMVAFIPSHTVE